MRTRIVIFFGGLLLIGALGLRAWKAPTGSNVLEEKPRCPVCGMFVEQYPTWIAQIRFRDGHVAHFDGAKDLFKYYFDVERYDPTRAASQIQSVQLTDYYTLEKIDGYQCHYVIGSDVLGPMGHELIPFASQKAANEFLADHHGKRVLVFPEVTKETISWLEGEQTSTLPHRSRESSGGGL